MKRTTRSSDSYGAFRYRYTHPTNFSLHELEKANAVSTRLFVCSLLAGLIIIAETIPVVGQQGSLPGAAELEDNGSVFDSATNASADEREFLLRPIRKSIRSESLSTDYIEEALDAPLKRPLRFEKESLRVVVSHIRNEYSLPVLIDEQGFDELAISPDSEITVDLERVSLRSALNIILRRPGLEETTFAILNEALTITTKECSSESKFTRVYPTEDFVYSNVSPGNGSLPLGGAFAEYSPLVALITDCVAPDTWSENGRGKGEINIIKPGILVVRQEYRVHKEIEQLLNDLRLELRNIEEQLGREAMQETGRFYRH
ncbi:hypothetical protein OAS39_07155 [Pirellulales bacterium]|nr:hypothetical protein [Pirellulales bacterium]